MRQVRHVLLAVLLVMAAAPAAHAIDIVGAFGDDTLSGTLMNDRIAGIAGDDRIYGLGGDDVVYGGRGEDTIDGDGACPPSGTLGASIYCIPGEDGDDRLLGGLDDDELRGNGGQDRLSGEAGEDRLSGDAGRDRLTGGPGRDRFSGGSGADVISARDGVREVIVCGSGRDRVTADRTDRVARSCETVRRPKRKKG